MGITECAQKFSDETSKMGQQVICYGPLKDSLLKVSIDTKAGWVKNRSPRCQIQGYGKPLGRTKGESAQYYEYI
jgi:hypothetical protein